MELPLTEFPNGRAKRNSRQQLHRRNAESNMSGPRKSTELILQIRPQGALNSAEKFADLIQSRFRLAFGKSRKFSADLDVIAIAREHQFILARLHDGDVFLRCHQFEFRDLQQKLHRRWKFSKTTAPLFSQIFESIFVRRLRELAIRLDALLRIADVFQRNVSRRFRNRLKRRWFKAGALLPPS